MSQRWGKGDSGATRAILSPPQTLIYYCL
jgi:hypothetical protein